MNNIQNLLALHKPSLTPGSRADKGQLRIPQQSYDLIVAGFLSNTVTASVRYIYRALCLGYPDMMQHNQGKRVGQPISLATVRRIRDDLKRDPIFKLAFYSEEDRKEYMRTYRGSIVTLHANDMWQLDMTRCDIEVVDPAQGWKIFRPRIQAIIDVYSGCFMGMSFSESEDQVQVNTALRRALLPKRPPHDVKFPMYGTPKRFYVDNGKTYGAHFERVCGDLGIEVVHSRPYVSWTRGKVERVFQTLHRYEAGHPGYTGKDATNRDSLGLKKLRNATMRWRETGKDPGMNNRHLTIGEYQSYILANIITYYHDEVLSDGKTRTQRFLDTAPPETLVIHNEDDLSMVIGERFTRVARKGSIRYNNEEWAIPDGTLAAYDGEVWCISDPFVFGDDQLLIGWEDSRGTLRKLGYAVPAPKDAASEEAAIQRRADKAVKKAAWAALEEERQRRARPELHVGHQAIVNAEVITLPRVQNAPKAKLEALEPPEPEEPKHFKDFGKRDYGIKEGDDPKTIARKIKEQYQ